MYFLEGGILSCRIVLSCCCYIPCSCCCYRYFEIFSALESFEPVLKDKMRFCYQYFGVSLLCLVGGGVVADCLAKMKLKFYISCFVGLAVAIERNLGRWLAGYHGKEWMMMMMMMMLRTFYQLFDNNSLCFFLHVSLDIMMQMGFGSEM